jgi:flavin reductase (DIM6/NTAB) family NADH-FMN oxidoreductase RutF
MSLVCCREARHVRTYAKRSFPLDEIRRFVEPGPIVLVSSQWKHETNIMTMGWHTMLSFSPALIGCYIWPENHSFDMIRKSKECVINIPTVDLAPEVVRVGNTSGRDVDKFAEFGLTAVCGTKVRAPLIAECYANLECRVADTRMVSKYSFFIFQVVKAHAPAAPKYPRTLHYRGGGIFMIAGKSVSFRKQFKPQNL